MIHFYRIARWRHLHRIPLLPGMIYTFNRIPVVVFSRLATSVGGYSTIGGRSGFQDAPSTGNDVVLHDVPGGAVAVGIPARLKPAAREARQ